MKRLRLHEYKHPFDTYPFEALCCGSWQMIEHIELRDGEMTIHFADKHHGIKEKGPFANIRVKSRPANLTDCTCFLRPGIDVCVLSCAQDTESSDEEISEPVWVDARISSVERKPHDSQCLCLFSVNLYVNQGPLGSEKGTLRKETEVVGIDQISILQKLDKNPCEGQFYRWDSSEDCTLLQRTKLFLGKFNSDLTWLLVASAVKQIAFDVILVENKIVYQVLVGADDRLPLKSNNQHALNFKVDNGIMTPTVVQFFHAVTKEVIPAADLHADESSQPDNVVNLRRSKRKRVRPERFLGADVLPEMDIGWVRSMPIRTDKWKEDEMYLPLKYLVSGLPSSFEEQTEDERDHSPEFHPLDELLISKTKCKSREVKSSMANQQQQQLAIAPVTNDIKSVAFEQFNSLAKSPGNYSRGSSKAAKTRRNYSRGISETSFGYYGAAKGPPAAKRMDDFELEETMFERKWGGKASNKKVKGAKHRVLRLKRDDSHEPKTYKKTTLSAGAYNKLINSYMKNIDSTIRSKEESHIVDQWEDFKAKRHQGQREETEQSAVMEEQEEDGECSETEMLWREMELSLASAYLLEENEDRVNTQTKEKSSDHCQHVFKLNEEIGILCHICGFVKTEIKYVTAPFLESVGWTAENQTLDEADSGLKTGEEEGLNLYSKPATSCKEEMPSMEENDNVWALIPDLRKKLHLHQKRAFEFLWRNIAGSLNPMKMEKSSKKIGGCVISHTPGAGKTFLIIAFLASYLKLFPGKRPLVLAPKTTLYTWYKEFIKWEIPIPVHLIHGRRTYRIFREKTVSFRGGPKPTQDVMHILDCLEKIQKWHAQPSVLVMGYTSFLTLMRDNSKFSHRKYMAKVLRESPGLLVLDEGHNPRSTKSRLRKVLMKVETDLRILLSGTLFQNNFCEYFNTLSLARPKFIREVLRALDPKFRRKKKGANKAQHLLESRARKFFLDHISRKIDSGEAEERLEGLNMLRKITNRFIDVYEGGSSDGLPGLQIYTILMNPTEIQNEMLVKLQQIMSKYHGYPLELELLITLASIHPWLVRTSNCVGKFFSLEEQRVIDELQFDFKKGSKVMFVLNLVYRVVKNEKVLIFCHNIAPINLFVQLFETVFRWQKGRELLVLTGDLELFERGKIMDRFEETGGPSKILLASITACAEGISLTAASRVILLDSEWNPSKTKQAIARAFRPGQQKVVYVYQLLASHTLEEDKFRRTTWKEWVSCMIFSEEFVEDPSRWQERKIEDDVLREMVEEDRVKSFHEIMKNEKASRGASFAMTM